MLVAVLTGCASNTANQEITVVSREEGSGTRSAFIELTGIEVDDVDQTTVDAEISNSTAVVMQTVAGNTAAIGYISLASLDDSIKAVTVDGVEASVDNILSGTYPISRPFNVATLGELTNEAAQDFLNYIMSDEGHGDYHRKWLCLHFFNRCIHIHQSKRYGYLGWFLICFPDYGEACRSLYGAEQQCDSSDSDF